MKNLKFERKLQSSKTPAYFEKTTEGFLLQHKKPKQEQRGIIGYLIPILFLVAFVHITGFSLLLIVTLCSITLLLNFIFHRDYRTGIITYIISKSRLFNPEVILSTYPLALGEECELTFRRRFKGNLKTKQSKELVFQIACVERVEYKAGKTTEVETHTIWESQPQSHSVPQDVDTLSFKTKFKVPNHLPPSFEGKHNQIRWIVVVEQNISRVFKRLRYSFVFVVDPVLAK